MYLLSERGNSEVADNESNSAEDDDGSGNDDIDPVDAVIVLILFGGFILVIVIVFCRSFGFLCGSLGSVACNLSGCLGSSLTGSFIGKDISSKECEHQDCGKNYRENL